MNRKDSAIARAAFASAPMSMMHARGFCFSPDADAGGGGDAGGAGSGGAAAKTPAEEMIPKAEAQAAFKSRDKAKAGVALFAQTFGIDPSDVEIKETGDKEKPYELHAPGLEEIKTAVTESRRLAAEKKKTSGKWEERETELNAAHQKQVQKLTTKYTSDIAARDVEIRGAAVDVPIRQAAIEEKAVTESLDDIVALIAGRVRVEIGTDEETGKLRKKITPLAEDGTPLLNAKGEPADVRQLVKEFLAKRPHFVQANFRSGPGAGGYGKTPAKGVTTNNVNGAAGVSAGRAFLGLA